MDAVPDQCCKTITDGCGKGKLSMSYEDAAKVRGARYRDFVTRSS